MVYPWSNWQVKQIKLRLNSEVSIPLIMIEGDRENTSVKGVDIPNSVFEQANGLVSIVTCWARSAEKYFSSDVITLENAGIFTSFESAGVVIKGSSTLITVESTDTSYFYGIYNGSGSWYDTDPDYRIAFPIVLHDRLNDVYFWCSRTSKPLKNTTVGFRYSVWAETNYTYTDEHNFVYAAFEYNPEASEYISVSFENGSSTYFNNWLSNNVTVIKTVGEDPYSGGGTSGSGGGTGSFDGTGDAISAPSVPTLGATTTGFVSLYNPTLSQVQELASYMWSDAFSIDSFKKLFADPMDTILGLSIVPVAVPDGETTELKVGNLSTGISITRAGAQYIVVDCGSIAVNEYWGAYLDYAPYTKLEIYLPYIGTHQLSADDVMGKTISVKYNVDILSGSCVAFITCGDSVLYTFSGQCSQNIPITGEDFNSNLMGAISFAASAGAVVASGGGAAAVMPAAAGLTSSYINAFKPDIQRSGNIGGTSGMLGIQVPYLILTRPRQCTPENQNKYLGYPSFITEDLSELSGYTEIEDIQLEGCTATDSEIDEIKSLLAGGVLL